MQVTATDVPAVTGVHALMVSVQNCVLATPAPLPSPAVKVTVWSAATQPVAALLVVVGSAASTVRDMAVAVPGPVLFVARMLSVSTWPLVPVMPVWVHV